MIEWIVVGVVVAILYPYFAGLTAKHCCYDVIIERTPHQYMEEARRCEGGGIVDRTSWVVHNGCNRSGDENYLVLGKNCLDAACTVYTYKGRKHAIEWVKIWPLLLVWIMLSKLWSIPQSFWYVGKAMYKLGARESCEQGWNDYH